MFSIYPPFYYGPHCAILTCITLPIIFLMHIFCIVHKECKQRSLWSFIYFLYHLSIALWVILVLIVGCMVNKPACRIRRMILFSLIEIIILLTKSS